MNIRLVLVLLPENGCREPALNAVAFARDPTKLDELVESKFSAGKDTNRRRVTDRIVNTRSGRLPLVAQSGHFSIELQCPLL